MTKRIFFFVGTTAEYIKLAPVMRNLNKRKIEYNIITSGQNEVNFNDLEYIAGKQKPYYSFQVKQLNLPLGISFHFLLWTVRSFFVYLSTFRKILKVYSDQNQIIFIVHGDTVTAAIGAIVARMFDLKVAHIEAGYRSFNIFEPFPEELCRIIVSFMANIHFCPNKQALNNIKARGGVKINTGVNTVYESCFASLNKKVKSVYLENLNKNKFFLLILHRQEHVIYKQNLTKQYIYSLLNYADQSKIKCIFVMHWITKIFLQQNNMYDEIINNPNIIVMPRTPHAEFMKILEKAEFIATDGGSNQQEAYYLGVPCLLLRKYTEQTEGTDSCVVLAKDNLKIVNNFLSNYKDRRTKKLSITTPPSEIIVNHLIKYK